jgi:hypothetical protein
VPRSISLFGISQGKFMRQCRYFKQPGAMASRSGYVAPLAHEGKEDGDLA